MSEELNGLPVEGQEGGVEAHEVSFKVATSRAELVEMVQGVGYIDGLSPQVIGDAIMAGDIDSMPSTFDLKEALESIIANEKSESSEETVH